MNRRSEDLSQLRRKVAAFRQLQHDTTAQLYSVTSALLSPEERMLESALRQLNQFRYDLDRLQFVTRDEVELFKKISEEHEQLIQLITSCSGTYPGTGIHQGKGAPAYQDGPVGRQPRAAYQ